MGRNRTREDGVGYTVRIPYAIKEDLDLLARYNYSSIASEILQAIRDRIEANRELLDSEKARLAELNNESH